MTRFIQFPATVTDPSAGIMPWNLGITGFTHRWDPTLVTEPVGSNVLSLHDHIGTLDLTAAASGTKTLTAAAGFKYLAYSAGGSLGHQPLPASSAGFTDGFSVVIVAKITAGNAVFCNIGGYAIDFGGNGKINIYNYAATTASLQTVANGTGWHIIVISFNGATTKATVDGVVYSATTFAAPTTYRNLYFGGGTSGIDGALFATHPTVLSDADRLTVHNTIKARLGI
jgi:hypothetical protein